MTDPPYTRHKRLDEEGMAILNIRSFGKLLMFNWNRNKLKIIYVAAATLITIVFLLALLAVSGPSLQLKLFDSKAFDGLFTGTGTVLLAIIAYALKEKGAVSSDQRKLDFEIQKERRKLSQDVQTSRSIILAEFSIMKTMAEDELHFVRQHTDQTYEYYYIYSQYRSPSTEVPVIGFLQDFDKLRQNVGCLTEPEATAVMAAYFSYIERRNYILRNSKTGSDNFANAISIGLVYYSFKDAFYNECLKNDLTTMRDVAEDVIKSIRMAKNVS